jgi:hypothetical protein
MLSDEEGLDRAYASDTNLYLDEAGTLFVSGTKGGLLGKEWQENYRDFGGGLLKKFRSDRRKNGNGRCYWSLQHVGESYTVRC